MLCRYCRKIMQSEYVSQPNGGYFEFHNCTNCKAVYECTSRTIKRGREKYELREKERWWNPTTESWED